MIELALMFSPCRHAQIPAVPCQLDQRNKCNFAKVTGYKLPVSIAAAAFSNHGKTAVYAEDAATAIRQAGIMQGKGNNVFERLKNRSGHSFYLYFISAGVKC